MRNKSIFTVTINNWEKHNGNKKKNHRYFLLEYRFFEDEKISQLRTSEALIFLKCLCIAADLQTNQCRIHAGLLPNRWRIGDELLENHLKSLQSFQLLSYEKNDVLYKRIEENTKEEKVYKEKKPVDRLALSMSPESKILKDFFNENKLGNLVKLVPDILNHFNNIESFDNWYKGLTCSKTFPKEKDFSEQSRYVSSAIKREIGLIKQENRNA